MCRGFGGSKRRARARARALRITCPDTPEPKRASAPDRGFELSEAALKSAQSTCRSCVLSSSATPDAAAIVVKTVPQPDASSALVTKVPLTAAIANAKKSVE